MKASRTARAVALVPALAAFLFVATAAAPARAQYQRTTAIAAGAIFGAVDLLFITYDLTMSERSKPPSKTMVFLEMPVMTLQLVTGLTMFITALQPDQRLTTLGIERDLYLPLGAVMATIAAPLFAHAIRHSTDRIGGGMHTLRLVPTRIGDARASGPGLALVGLF